jgi:hypothetical protein
LWQQPGLRNLSIALILVFTMALGLASWYAAFLIRSHGMDITEVGLWLGLSFGVAGLLGVWLGGYVTSRWLADNEGGQMRLTAIAVGALFPWFVCFLLAPEKYLALFCLVPLVVVFNFFLGPSFALLQRLVPDDMRATTVAVVMLLANLIGMGVGPQFVGILSDLMASKLGQDSLRYAMLIMSLVSLWASYHFWIIGRTVKDDLRKLKHKQVDHAGTTANAGGTASTESYISP